VAAYLLRRLLIALPLLVVVSFVVFYLSRSFGGDPVDAILGEKGSAATRERLTKDLALDKPIVVQYVRYLKGIVTRGDLGHSYIMNESVSAELRVRFPRTIELTFAAMILAILIGIPAGVLSAVYKSTWVDYLAMGVSLAGVSIPVFWLGMLLILAFSGLLPVSGNLDPSLKIDRVTGLLLIDTLLAGNFAAWWSAAKHLVLPSLTLCTIPLAMTARITRASMLEVLGMDYIRTARAKGLPGLTVVMRHAFRNALIPVITLIGLEFGYLLGGAVLTESVFDWPGMGMYLVNRVFQSDPIAICGASIVVASTFIVVNLVVDALYAFIDPRIRYGSA